MTDLTRTTKRLSDMDKKKEIVGSSDTPVITDKKVTTTPPTTSIGATTPSQSEEESNEQTQTPPTTPAPAVTTTAPQYDDTDTDTDRRNQANLAAQTTTAPTANENMILQFDENNKPILVKTDVATPKITPKTTDTAPSTTTPATEGEEYHTYSDILAKLAPQTSDEDKRKQMRRERRKAIVSALGDGLSALSNLYFTTKGAPDQGIKPGMTDAAKKRMDDLRAQWQKEKNKYQDLMLKGLEMDREQGNWLKSYELQKNADKRAEAEEERKAKTFEKELPLLEKKVQAAEEELKKLIRENKVGDATWEKSVEVAEKELAWKEYELDFMKTHKGYTPKEYNEHLATERYRSRTLSNKGGKSGKSGKEKSGGNIIMSTQSGYAYNPTDAQVRQAYRWLQSRHFVSGNAKSIREMAAELQNYYTVSGGNRNKYDGVSIKKSRLDDIKGGPRVDAMLGGKTRGDGSTTIDAAIGGGSGALLDGLL